MNESDFLRQLGTRMSAAAEPKIGALENTDLGIDVAAGVLQRIRQRPTSVIDPRLSLVTAGACALSAVVVLAAWSAGANTAVESIASLEHATVASTDPEAVLRVLEP